jgi:protein tyrosine/serine phosphatase
MSFEDTEKSASPISSNGNGKITRPSTVKKPKKSGQMNPTSLQGVQCEIDDGRPLHFVLDLGKRGLLGAARFPVPGTNWKKLSTRGFRWVICACSDDPGYHPFPLDFLERIELTDLYSGGEPPDPDQELEHIAAIALKAYSKLDEGGVLVHCQGGRGRTGTIIGSILRRCGYDSAKIIHFLDTTYVEAGRPGWPESPWQAQVF